jgi:hypothetical protein
MLPAPELKLRSELHGARRAPPALYPQKTLHAALVTQQIAPTKKPKSLPALSHINHNQEIRKSGNQEISLLTAP